MNKRNSSVTELFVLDSLFYHPCTGTSTPLKRIQEVLQIRLISSTEQTQFDELMQQHHRRGSLRRIGHELHFIATHNDNWISLASFSPATLKCTARDEWIGWQRQYRTDRLRLIANNSRFLILPGHHYPNLASRMLSGCRRRLAKDWQTQFCKPLVLLETYVDSDYHVGTIYGADNWIFVGHTPAATSALRAATVPCPVSRSSWCSSNHCSAMRGVIYVRRSCR